MENETKTCKTCKRELSVISFYLRKAAPNRYQSDCKECYKEKRKERYIAECEIRKYKKRMEELVESGDTRELVRQQSKESYRRQKEKIDRKIRKEINDLL